MYDKRRTRNDNSRINVIAKIKTANLELIEF